MAESLTDQLKRRRELLDAPETAAETAPRGPKKKKKKKKKVAERAATGRDFASENKRVLIEQLDKRTEAARAAGNVDLVNELKKRRKSILEAI